jgi:hypothetical protein
MIDDLGQPIAILAIMPHESVAIARRENEIKKLKAITGPSMVGKCGQFRSFCTKL